MTCDYASTRRASIIHNMRARARGERTGACNVSLVLSVEQRGGARWMQRNLYSNCVTDSLEIAFSKRLQSLELCAILVQGDGRP